MMNIYDACDGNRGPQIQSNTLNTRKISSGFLATLTKTLAQGKRIADEKTVLTMICSKDNIHLPSLATSISELDITSRIEWTALSKERNIVLGNGQHRMEANIKHVDKMVKGIKELKVKIPKLEKQIAQEKEGNASATPSTPLVSPTSSKANSKGKGKKEPALTPEEDLVKSRKELINLEDTLEQQKMWGIKIYDAGNKFIHYALYSSI